MTLSPEPWELSVEGDIIFDSAGFPVAIKPTFSGASGDMRLMACAPRLMALLKEIASIDPSWGDYEFQVDIVDVARALLAKIEGGGQ